MANSEATNVQVYTFEISENDNAEANKLLNWLFDLKRLFLKRKSGLHSIAIMVII